MYRSKSPSKTELLALSRKARGLGIGLLFDAVLNHKAEPDEFEQCRVIDVDPDNRMREIRERLGIGSCLGFERG